MSTYRFLVSAEVTTEKPLKSGEQIIVYQCVQTGKVWATREADFNTYKIATSKPVTEL